MHARINRSYIHASMYLHAIVHSLYPRSQLSSDFSTRPPTPLLRTSPPNRRIQRNLPHEEQPNRYNRNNAVDNGYLCIIVPNLRPRQMRRCTPNVQKHAHHHTQRRRGQKHAGHLPRHELQPARDAAAGGAAVSAPQRQQPPDIVQSVAVRGQAVQAHGLVGGGQDAEEREDEARVPGCADGPGGEVAVGEDVGPGAGGGEDAGEEGGHYAYKTQLAQFVIPPPHGQFIAFIRVLAIQQYLNGIVRRGVRGVDAAAEKSQDGPEAGVLVFGRRLP